MLDSDWGDSGRSHNILDFTCSQYRPENRIDFQHAGTRCLIALSGCIGMSFPCLADWAEWVPSC